MIYAIVVAVTVAVVAVVISYHKGRHDAAHELRQIIVGLNQYSGKCAGGTCGYLGPRCPFHEGLNKAREAVIGWFISENP